MPQALDNYVMAPPAPIAAPPPTPTGPSFKIEDFEPMFNDDRFKKLPFEKRAEKVEQALDLARDDLAMEPDFDANAHKKFGQFAAKQRAKLAETESLGEKAKYVGGVIGDAAVSLARTAEGVAFDASPYYDGKMRVPFSTVGPLFNQKLEKAVNAADYYIDKISPMAGGQAKAVESSLDKLKADLENGNFDFSPQGVGTLLATYHVGLSDQQKEFYKSLYGDEAAASKWADENSIYAERNAPLLARFAKTQDPAAWDAFRANILQTPDAAAANAESKRILESSASAKALTAMTPGSTSITPGLTVGQDALNMAADPINAASMAFPAARMFKPGGAMKNLAIGTAEAQALGQVGLSIENPAATVNERFETAKNMLAMSLGMSGAGYLAQRATNRGQAPGADVLPNQTPEAAAAAPEQTFGGLAEPISPEAGIPAAEAPPTVAPAASPVATLPMQLAVGMPETPSPAPGMIEKPSPTITGSNEQMGSEMPVSPQASEAPVSSQSTQPSWMSDAGKDSIRALGPDRIEILKDMAADRATAKEIAKALGVDVTDVVQARLELGIPAWTEATQSIAMSAGNNTPIVESPAFTQWADEHRASKTQPQASTQTPESTPITEAPPTAPPEAPTSAPPRDPNQTSLRRSVVDEERAARGEAPIEQPAIQSWGENGEQAAEILANNPRAGDQLVTQLQTAPRALSATENAMLLLHKVQVRHDLRKTGEAVIAATDPQEKAGLQANYQNLLDAQNAIDEVSRAAGTESGRSLAARKQMRDEDFSTESLLQQFRVANDGAPLTPEDIAQVESLAKEIKTATDKLDAKEAERDGTAAAVVIFELQEQAKAEMQQLRDLRKTQAGKEADDRARTLRLALMADNTTFTPAEPTAKVKRAPKERLSPQEKADNNLADLEASAMVQEAIDGGQLGNLGYQKIELPTDWMTKAEYEFILPHLNEDGTMPKWLKDKFSDTGANIDQLAQENGMDVQAYGEQLATELQQADDLYRQVYQETLNQAKAERGELPPDMLRNGTPFMDATGLLLATDIIRTMARQSRDLYSFVQTAVKTLGKWVKPHLDKLWALSKKGADAIHAYLKDLAAVAQTKHGTLGGRAAFKTTGAPSTGLTPTKISQHAEVMAADLRAGMSKEEARKNATRDFNGRIDDAFDTIYDAAVAHNAAILQKVQYQASPQGILARAKQKAPSNTLDPRLATQMVKATLKAATSDQRLTVPEIITKVTNDLKEIYPTLTEREVRDAISGYGKNSKPSADQLSKQVADIKAQARLISQLEDATKGTPPLRTGYQKGQPSQKVRELTTQVKDMMRKMGIEAVAPEKQLSTALDGVKNRLKNRINDITKKLMLDEETPTRTPIEYDPEATALKAEADRLRKIVSDIEGTPEASPEQLLSQAISAAERSIEDLETRIKNQDFSKAPSRVPESQRLKDLRKTRDTLREQYELLKEQTLGTPEMSQEARTKLAMANTERSIADLETRIKNNDFGPRTNKPVNVPAELKALRDKRDTLRKHYDELKLKAVGKRGLTDAQKISVATKALEKSIADYTRRIQQGDQSVRMRPGNPSTPELIQLRKERKALSEEYQALVDSSGPPVSPEYYAMQQLKKRLNKQRADLEEQLRTGDFSKPTKKETAYDAEATQLRYELQKVKEKVADAMFLKQQENRNLLKKSLDNANKVVNAAKAIKSSVDLSGVFMQGGFLSLGHPERLIKAFGPMLRAFASEKAQFEIAEEIANRPNAPLYKQAKLFLSDQNSNLLNMREENFMSDLANKVPLVARSGRAYSTFLNKLRADSFDAMVARLTRDGTPTLQEAKNIAEFVNIATGRGKLPGNDQSAAVLNMAFWSPRLMASRFNLISGQPLRKGLVDGTGSARVKRLIAEDYARFIAGVGVVYGLMSLMKDDDDKTPLLEVDPRSSDFGKARLGDTRVNPTAGISPSIVFLARMITQQTKNSKGKVVDISGDKVPFNGMTTGDVIFNFLRSKANPTTGLAYDLRRGQDFAGMPQSRWDMLKEYPVPMSLSGLKDRYEEQGPVRGTALTLSNFLGINDSTYKPRKKPNN